jgi:hypothetical protein
LPFVPCTGAVMDREGHRVALAERNHLHAALHPWPLFGERELASYEVLVRLREQDCHLDRKREVAVQVLMETVEIPRQILQQQRRRARLAGVMASLEERGMVVGIAFINSHADVPCVGDAGEARIKRCPQVTEQIRERVFEIAVLALAEAVPRHVDMTAEMALVGIEARDARTFFQREQLRQDAQPKLSSSLVSACQS